MYTAITAVRRREDRKFDVVCCQDNGTEKTVTVTADQLSTWEGFRMVLEDAGFAYMEGAPQVHRKAGNCQMQDSWQSWEDRIKAIQATRQ